MNPDLFPVFAFFAFGLGACVASFLNVVAWRVPRGESVVSPPSHCPKCNAHIKWWQNVPIISWLALRGKCANCRAPISPRYIVVEALGGVLFLAVFLLAADQADAMRWMSPPPLVWALLWLSLVVAWIWISLMLVGSVIDCDHQLLPDFVTVGGMILGIVHAAATNAIAYTLGGGCSLQTFAPLIRSVGGLAFGFGLLWLVRWLGTLAFKREAMGMGDVFLMGAVGALYGPVAVVVTLVMSSLIGSVVGLGLILLSKVRLGGFAAIPFGPFICAGCLVWMFRGPQLVDWYLRLVGFR